MRLTPAQVPPDREEGARRVAAAVATSSRVALTTHVNADGDGIGSEVALVHLLRDLGKEAWIVNPTPVPRRYGFLAAPLDGADRSAEPAPALKAADLLIVVDISDLDRLGSLADMIRRNPRPTACIDHHVSPGTLPDGPRLVDPKASATCELVTDLAVTAGWEITADIARALYVGILTDTGGFRFGNTTPRVLRTAAFLLESGVDPERVYELVYATAPAGRVRLTAEVLQTLQTEPETGIAWVTVPPGALERHGVGTDDLDGLVEFARSIQGTRLALMFRTLANGKVKVSFRSVGDFDVARFAQQFGGGGHVKAAGASIAGTMEQVQQQVLAAARTALAARAAPR